MLETINLISLFLLSTVTLSFCSSKIVRFIVSFVWALFIILQISSLDLGSALIDYKFYLHFNLRDMTLGYSWFIPQIIAGIFLFLLILYLLYQLGSITSKKLKLSYKRIFIIPILIIHMLWSNGIASNIYHIIQYETITRDNLNNTLSQLGLPIAPTIEAHKGKNIIILSLESYEKGYLHHTMKHITPNMQGLMKKWTFFDMKQNFGSGWTLASLYPVQTRAGGEVIPDYDLFQEAKNQLLLHKKSEKPFALFMSTLPPSGLYDERMLQFVEEEDDNMLFMVKSVDYMIEKDGFYYYVRKLPFYPMKDISTGQFKRRGRLW